MRNPFKRREYLVSCGPDSYYGPSKERGVNTCYATREKAYRYTKSEAADMAMCLGGYVELAASDGKGEGQG